MKLILSTLALGTAAASPFTWHEGPTQAVPAAEPIRLVALEPGAQDAEELRRVAAELEAQLVDLRAELERTRARAEEARMRAEAEHRSEVSRVLENGERGRQVIARRWHPAARSEGLGEAHEVHVVRGPDGPLQLRQGLVRHDAGVRTIHITIEKGDLHINADGVRSRAREADPGSRNPRRASRARKRKKDAEARPERNGRKKRDAPRKARKKKKKKALNKKAASKKAKGRKDDPRKTGEKKAAPEKAKGKSRAPKKAKGRKDDPRKRREKKTAPKKTNGRFSLFGDGDAEVFLASPEVEGTIWIDGEKIEFDGDDLPDLRHSDVKDKVIVHGFSKGGDGAGEAFEAWLQELINDGETAGPSPDEASDLGAWRAVASPPPAPTSSAR